MRNTTNRKQYEILFDYIQEHPDLVLENSKLPEAFAKRKQLWIEIVDKLNFYGPPKRNWFDWKRVWADYKHKLKRKLCSQPMSNSNHTNRTKRPTFSEIDKAVIDFLGLRETLLADGKDARSRQTPEVDSDSDNSSDTETELEKDEETSCEKENDTGRYINNKKESSVGNRVESILQDEILRYALEATKGLGIGSVKWSASFGASPVDTEGTTKEKQEQILELLKMLNQRLKDSNEIEEQTLHLEQKKIELMKIYDLEKNKQAYIEIELKRQELEIYELKAKRYCKHCTANSCCL